MPNRKSSELVSLKRIPCSSTIERLTSRFVVMQFIIGAANLSQRGMHSPRAAERGTTSSVPSGYAITSRGTRKSLPHSRAWDTISSNALGIKRSSLSWKYRYVPRAISMPRFRGALAQPEFSSCSTRNSSGCAAAAASHASPEPSVDPSSTKITSHRAGSIVWETSESRQAWKYSPGL